MTEERSAENRYEENVARLEASLSQDKQQFLRIGRLRHTLGVVSLLLIFIGLVDRRLPPAVWIAGCVGFVIFLFVASIHEAIEKTIEQKRVELRGFHRLLARRRRDWTQLKPLSSELALEVSSDISHDLDLFGDRSLYRWISLASTRQGANTIANWMCVPSDESTVAIRQSAVRYLVALYAWREAFFRLTNNYQSKNERSDDFLNWTSNGFAPMRSTAWRVGSWTGVGLLIFGLVAISIGLVTRTHSIYITGAGSAIAALIYNLLFAIAFNSRVHDLFKALGDASEELLSLKSIAEKIEELSTSRSPGSPATPQLIEVVSSSMTSGSRPASQSIESLRRCLQLANLHRHPAYFFFYLIVQTVVLWDIRIVEYIERWRTKDGRYAKRWFDAIGTAEALFSSAMVADENPNWCFPNIHPRRTVQASQQSSVKPNSNPLICAEQFSHPLLSETRRVTNDVIIDSAKPLLLVTGSNMAGKSTFLRTIGANMILARLGAPVCASNWSSLQFDLATSMRVQDSLVDGVSFFLAELKRIKHIVDHARQHQTFPLLVLLDEILQGTNSVERKIAVESILEQLLALECCVACSTHDLDLAKSRAVSERGTVVHFREHFIQREGKEEMVFDYRLQSGPTPTTNALKLLEWVGLGKQIK